MKRLFAALIALALAAPAEAQTAYSLALTTTVVAPINPLIYGVNYVWNNDPNNAISSWLRSMKSPVGAKLYRYPGGWPGEWYDWLNFHHNTLLDGSSISYTSPGANPTNFLSDIAGVPATFMLPTQQVISLNAGTKAATVTADILALVGQHLAQLALWGGSVARWEIGNEWWLQAGAITSASRLTLNAQRYAALLATAVPVIKAAYPSIKLYATADWQTTGATGDQFLLLKALVNAGPVANPCSGFFSGSQLTACNSVFANVWANIDGISIHPYCGTIEFPLCASIPQAVSIIKSETGKSDIYASEWSVSHQYSIPAGQTATTDYGIKNASATIFALARLAAAGVQEAAYWPDVGLVPNIALLDTDYTPLATGYAFGWMSQYYQGSALQVTGDLPAVAARSSAGVTFIFPSQAIGPATVNLSLAGSGLTKVASAQVIWTASPDSLNLSQNVTVSTLPYTLANGVLTFSVNIGTKKSTTRGMNWEIARITLQ
jgi:hypothetical protein